MAATVPVIAIAANRIIAGFLSVSDFATTLGAIDGSRSAARWAAMAAKPCDTGLAGWTGRDASCQPAKISPPLPVDWSIRFAIRSLVIWRYFQIKPRTNAKIAPKIPPRVATHRTATGKAQTVSNHNKNRMVKTIAAANSKLNVPASTLIARRRNGASRLANCSLENVGDPADMQSNSLY